MDTQRFDRLTSTLVETRTRRGTLRLLAAAALGAGGLTVLGRGESEARKRRKSKKNGSGGSGGSGQRSTPRDQCPVSAKTNAPVCGMDPDGECDCHRAIEGNNFCGGFITSCEALHPCASTQDCRETVGFHFVCQAADGGGCGQVCVPECGNTTPY
jgi:hypothetical protein